MNQNHAFNHESLESVWLNFVTNKQSGFFVCLLVSLNPHDHKLTEFMARNLSIHVPSSHFGIFLTLREFGVLYFFLHDFISI